MSGGEPVGGSRRGVSRPGDAGSPGAIGHRQERLYDWLQTRAPALSGMTRGTYGYV